MKRDGHKQRHTFYKIVQKGMDEIRKRKKREQKIQKIYKISSIQQLINLKKCFVYKAAVYKSSLKVFFLIHL